MGNWYNKEQYPKERSFSSIAKEDVEIAPSSLYARTETKVDNQKVELDSGLPVLIVAIDFGTTYSGYAFSFSDGPAIFMNKNWGAQSNCSSYKAPTCVLTNQMGEFHSFGYEAERDFSMLKDKDRETFHLYRHFKMALQNKVSLRKQIKSTTGKFCLAVKIFSMALKYLKQHALNAVNKTLEEPADENSIRWVLTVPAIWNEDAKMFMREASFRAGLIKDNLLNKLLIALEPEAALLYCQRHLEPQVKWHGATCMVIDAGGGTVDIVTQKIKRKDIQEVKPPTSGPYGGLCIDQCFEKIMESLFTEEFLDSFKNEHQRDWLNFMLNFVIQKISLDIKTTKIAISSPWSLPKAVEKTHGRNMSELLSKKQKDVTFQNGHLQIGGQTYHSLYEEVLQDIMKHIKDKYDTDFINQLDYVFLVGGFSQFQPLKMGIEDFFSPNVCKVVCPTEAQVAVLKGAVMFGQKPDIIHIRIAKASYGVETMKIFDSKEHNVKYLDFNRGKMWCVGLLKPLIRKGQQMEVGQKVQHELGTNFESLVNQYTDVDIFETQEEDVKYSNHPSVHKIGSVRVHHELEDQNENDIERRKIVIKIEIGRTELKIAASDTQTEHWVDTKVEFNCC